MRTRSSIRTGVGDRARSRSRSTILSRYRTGDGERSLIRSLVSTTRERSLSGAGEGDRCLVSRSTTRVRTLSTGGGEGDLAMILSCTRTVRIGDGDRGLGLVTVSVFRSLNTIGPGSFLP
jgi:hypothetical protein